MNLPPLPPWERLHVLVIHFPIGLLLVVPLLILLAMFLHKRLPGIGLVAWLLLLIGTVACWVAVATGNAAFNETGEMPDAAREIMMRHQKMGVDARNMFTALCGAYGLLLILPLMIKRLKGPAVMAAGSVVILAVYAWMAIYLANAAHLGGRLVHEYGVRAEPPPAAEPAK